MNPSSRVLWPRRLGAALTMALTVPFAERAAAQEPVDSLRAEVERLASLVDSLQQEVARLQAAGQADQAEDALAQLRAAAEEAAAGAGPTTPGPEDQEFVGRQRSLQALNPEISVNADVFGHVNKDEGGEQTFFAREFEVSLVSNLDPFSRAKIFFSHHGEGAEITPFPEEGEEEGHGGFEVEEGYAEWVGLPGGLSLKLGKFFQHFGQLNRWHTHALPSQTRSLPHLAFIGEGSLAQAGASLHWLAPIGGEAGIYEATVEVTRSSNESLFGASGGRSLLGHVNAFWNLSPSTDLDLGLSWIDGAYEDADNSGDRDLYGAEIAFSWRPPAQARYRGFTLRAGIMALEGLVSGATPPPGDRVTLTDERALGWWGAGELRLSQTLLVGGQYGWVEDPTDTSQTAWIVSPTVTWWQSEWVRLRLEYDVLGRSFTTNNEGRLFLQLTFAMGPHKHETY